jgi:glycosyltransferase involved in cell wall biosynthesis
VPKALIVTYYFPPLGGIGSVRVAAFARHLPAYGWGARVLAPSNGAYFVDPDSAFPEERVVRSASIELSRLGKRALRTGGDDVRPTELAGGLRGALRELARSWLYFPDAQVGWYPMATAAGLRLLRRERFDAIFSSSFPVTAHLIARRLARAARLPWVAEFRDPWSEMLPPGRRARRRAARLEAALAVAADAVVMPSPSWAAHHARLWGRSVEVIPNGHEGGAPLVATPDRFTLSYLGSFYPATQRLDTAWDALAALRKLGEPRIERLRIIGELHPQMRAELIDRGLDDLLEVTGFIPHGEALRTLAASSALLVAGPADASGILRGQVAAKLAEYLATELPIVYVGDPECDAADLLRGYPCCHVVAPGDVAGAIQALRRSCEERAQRDASALSRSALTGRLAAILDRVCSRRCKR